jgi:hypothetical protein
VRRCPGGRPTSHGPAPSAGAGITEPHWPPTVLDPSPPAQQRAVWFTPASTLTTTAPRYQAGRPRRSATPVTVSNPNPDPAGTPPTTDRVYCLGSGLLSSFDMVDAFIASARALTEILSPSTEITLPSGPLRISTVRDRRRSRPSHRRRMRAMLARDPEVAREMTTSVMPPFVPVDAAASSWRARNCGSHRRSSSSSATAACAAG